MLQCDYYLLLSVICEQLDEVEVGGEVMVFVLLLIIFVLCCYCCDELFVVVGVGLQLFNDVISIGVIIVQEMYLEVIVKLLCGLVVFDRYGIELWYLCLLCQGVECEVVLIEFVMFVLLCCFDVVLCVKVSEFGFEFVLWIDEVCLFFVKDVFLCVFL